MKLSEVAGVEVAAGGDGADPQYLSPEQLAAQNNKPGIVKLSSIDQGAKPSVKLSQIEAPIQNDNALEDQLTARKKQLEDQQKAAYAKEAEIAKQEEIQNRPENWSSSRFKAEAPKPQTPEEQAVYDATIEQKKAQEGALKEKLLPPDLKRDELQIGPPDPDKEKTAQSLTKIAMGGIFAASQIGAESADAGLRDPGQENARAQNTFAIQQNLEREAKLPSIYKDPSQEMKDRLGEDFVNSRAESISKWSGIPFSDISREYKALIRRPEITGIRPDTPTFKEFISVPMTGAVTMGLMSNPIGVAIGVAGFMALDEAENAVISAIKKRPYILGAGKNISDLLPEQASEASKSIVDIVDFIGKGLVLGGISTRAPKISEFLTKQIVETYNLPRDVYIDPVKIKGIFGTPSDQGVPISAGELDLVKGLGLDGKQYREAMRKGITIKVPVEKITTLRDRPYWAKLKEAIGLKPSEEIKIARPSKSSVKLSEIEYKGPTKLSEIPKDDGITNQEWSPKGAQMEVEKQGGTFLGITKGFTKKSGIKTPDLIQFRAPSGTTLALPADKFTPENIKAKIDDAEKLKKSQAKDEEVATKEEGKVKIYANKGMSYVVTGSPKIEAVEKFGLKPGDRVVQVGVPAKSGKETLNSRVTYWDDPITYLGTFDMGKDAEGQALIFETKSVSGEKVYAAYPFRELKGSKPELQVSWESSAGPSTRIYKAEFKKATTKLSAIKNISQEKKLFESVKGRPFSELTREADKIVGQMINDGIDNKDLARDENGKIYFKTEKGENIIRHPGRL